MEASVKRTNPRSSRSDRHAISALFIASAGLLSGVSGACFVTDATQKLLTPVDPEMAVAMTLSAAAPTAAAPTAAATTANATETPVDSMPAAATTGTSEPGSPYQPDPNCPMTRIRVGEWTRVALDPPIANLVRDEPSLDTGTIIGRAAPGTVLRVLDGPDCKNEMLWWQVRLENGSGLEGWTAEGPTADWLDPGSAEPP